MISVNKITANRYDTALTYMALVMEKYGDEFWPIFQVLEDEHNFILERQRKIGSRIIMARPKSAVEQSEPNLIIFESA